MWAQGAAAYPENEDQQQRLREAAEGLRVATNAAAQNAIKKKLVNRLEVSHKSQHLLTAVFFYLIQTQLSFCFFCPAEMSPYLSLFHCFVSVV